MEYYIYVYLDPRKPGFYKYENYEFDFEPFYIGKGKNLRLFKHLESTLKNKNLRNPYKFNKIKKILNENLNPIIIKLKNNLTNYESCLIEKELIKLIGLKVENKGPLLNICQGGIGGDTFTNNPNKELIRKKLSEKSSGQNNYFYGKSGKLSISHQQKGKSHWNYGRNHSNETKEKLSSLRKCGNNSNAIKLYQYDKNLNLIKIWPCIKSCIKSYNSPIYNKCKKSLYKSFYNNFYWSIREITEFDIKQFKIDKLNELLKSLTKLKKELLPKVHKNKGKKLTKEHKLKCIRRGIENGNALIIHQYDLDGNFIKTFYTAYEAANEINVNIRRIPRECRKNKSMFDFQINGFRWKLETKKLKK